MQTGEYQKGYAAGRAKTEKDLLNSNQYPTQKERIYLECLKLAMEQCRGWQIDGKTINTAEGYCTVAKIFADNSISKIKEM